MAKKYLDILLILMILYHFMVQNAALYDIEMMKKAKVNHVLCYIAICAACCLFVPSYKKYTSNSQ